MSKSNTTKNLEWYVLNYDFNSNSIILYNVLKRMGR